MPDAPSASDGFNQGIGTVHAILKVLGLWPFNEERDLATSCRTVVPAALIFFFITIAQTRKAILVRHDLNTILEVLTTADIIESLCLVKLLVLWHYQKVFKTLLLHILRDWRSTSVEEQRVMWRNADSSRFITTLCVCMTSGSVIACGVVFILTIDSKGVYHELDNGTYYYAKPFFLNAHFSYDASRSPIYEVTCACQFAAAIFGTFAFSSFDGLLYFAILHYSGQLHNLKRRLQNIVTECRRERVAFARILAALIKRHLQITSSTDIIEYNFNKTLLLQVLATTIIFCLQGYQFILVISSYNSNVVPQAIFFLIFMVGNLHSIFLYCYIAEIIRNESQHLFFAAYDTNWFELPPRDSRLLVIFMCRTKTPIEITAGKFAVFSLDYFVSILKSSMGYLSVLLALKDKLVAVT